MTYNACNRKLAITILEKQASARSSFVMHYISNMIYSNGLLWMNDWFLRSRTSCLRRR